MTENAIKNTQAHYIKKNEDDRLMQDKSHMTEYILSMHVLEKYISPQKTVIDVGCGTGRYTVALSPHCQKIMAVDLMDNLLDVLRQKIKTNNLQNISCLCANVIDIPTKIHQKYQVVLCMGPLYHLSDTAMRAACYESLKHVATDDAIFIFAYLTPLAALSGFLKEKLTFHTFYEAFQKEQFYFKPFFFSDPAWIEKELSQHQFEIIQHVALDPIAGICRQPFNGMSEAHYQDFINTLKQQSDYAKLLPLSAHNMIVARLKTPD